MKYLGLDLGTKTLGLAIADEKVLISSPLKTIKYNDIDELIEEVLSIIEEKKVSRLALGLPKNMDGSLGFAAERSLSFKERLEEKTDVPITLIDERLSTVEAEGYLINEGIKGKKKKDIIDAIAANIILDTFIRMKGREEDGKR